MSGTKNPGDNKLLKDASLTGDPKSLLRTGLIGRIDTFDLYVTTLYTAVVDGAFNCYHILYGHKSAVAYGAQVNKIRNIDDPDDFGKLVQGLIVYGYKALAPTGLGEIYARKA